MAQKLTQKYIKQCFEYNPETGVFKKKKRPRHHFSTDIGYRRSLIKYHEREGEPAGTVNAIGYLVISVNRVNYTAHRLAWLYHYGHMPDGNIDHIDGNPLNNSISNLRIATHEQNSRNVRMRPENKTGIVGVIYEEKYDRWKAFIGVGSGKSISKNFKTLLDAAAFRKSMEITLNYHKNHGRKAVKGD